MKIRIHPSFIVYITAISIFASLETSISALIALSIHEASHIIASKWFNERIEMLDLTPFGGVITYASEKSPQKGLKGCIIAAAGPIGNYGMILLLTQPFMQNLIANELLRQSVIINLGMMLLNLLPVLPLDGGRIVFCAGYYLFSISQLTTILSFAGIGVASMLIGLGLYAAWTLECVNISLLMIGIYLAIYAQKSRVLFLTENLYALLQEKQQWNVNPVKTQIISVLPETPLKDALQAAETARKIIFYTNISLKDYWIEDTEVITCFLQSPDSDIYHIIEKKIKK